MNLQYIQYYFVFKISDMMCGLKTLISFTRLVLLSSLLVSADMI